MVTFYAALWLLLYPLCLRPVEKSSRVESRSCKTRVKYVQVAEIKELLLTYHNAEEEEEYRVVDDVVGGETKVIRSKTIR